MISFRYLNILQNYAGHARDLNVLKMSMQRNNRITSIISNLSNKTDRWQT